MNKRLKKKLRKRHKFKKYNNPKIKIQNIVNWWFSLESTQEAIYNSWQDSLFFGSGMVKIEYDNDFPIVKHIPYPFEEINGK